MIRLIEAAAFVVAFPFFAVAVIGAAIIEYEMERKYTYAD